MYDMYAKATRILIWLGEADYNSNLIFSRKPVRFRRIPGPDREFIPFSEEDTGPLESDIWRDLIERPWWRRVWTLQEGLIASIHSQSLILCGNEPMS